MSLNIPFKRKLYPPDDSLHRGGDTGTQGDDVLGVKIAISRMGFWPWQEFDESYNNKFSHGSNKASSPVSRSGVAGFQRAMGVLPPTGWYGKETHYELVNSKVPYGLPHAGEWAFDKRSIVLYQGFENTTPEEEIVKLIYDWWDLLVVNRNQIHYNQFIRPIVPLHLHQNPPVFPTILDCSGTVTYVSWLAGAKSPDPFYGYSGYGNTASLIDGGQKIDISEVDKYAKNSLVLAFYGPTRWWTKHVVSCRSSNVIYSNGSEASPEILDKIRYRNDFLECRRYDVL